MGPVKHFIDYQHFSKQQDTDSLHWMLENLIDYFFDKLKISRIIIYFSLQFGLNG